LQKSYFRYKSVESSKSYSEISFRALYFRVQDLAARKNYDLHHDVKSDEEDGRVQKTSKQVIDNAIARKVILVQFVASADHQESKVDQAKSDFHALGITRLKNKVISFCKFFPETKVSRKSEEKENDGDGSNPLNLI
jgi:hypothetical protein